MFDQFVEFTTAMGESPALIFGLLWCATVPVLGYLLFESKKG